MVNGITRQVIVVKGSGEELFDQAIFLVRNDVIAKGGFTESDLLKEAKQLGSPNAVTSVRQNLRWLICGATIVGLFWIISYLI